MRADRGQREPPEGAGGDDTHDDQDDLRALVLDRPRLRPADTRLLGLLVAAEVLSTGQLRRMTGSPERTVQYRLAGLAGRGLVGRVRPLVDRGTSPILWWATPFGARAIGALDDPPLAIDLDRADGAAGLDRRLPRVWLVAAMNELRLGLAAPAPTGGLELVCWERTPCGVRIDGARRLRVDARFSVHAGHSVAGGLVWLDDGRVPRTRMAGPLGAFARLTAPRPSSTQGPRSTGGGVRWLLVLARSPGRVAGWLAAAEELRGEVSAGLDRDVAAGASGRVAVYLSRSPSADVLAGPWYRPGADRPARLADVLRAQADHRNAAVVGGGQ